jgi:hypothetical protein
MDRGCWIHRCWIVAVGSIVAGLLLLDPSSLPSHYRHSPLSIALALSALATANAVKTVAVVAKQTMQQTICYGLIVVNRKKDQSLLSL